MKEIPQEWKLALMQVQIVDPDAVISGGALRDLDNEKPVTDLDIFVSNGTKIQEVKGSLAVTFGQVQWEDCTIVYQGAVITASRPRAVKSSIRSSLKIGGVPINITKLNSGLNPSTRWRLHDFGLCQIAFDGQNLDCTEQYIQDKENKVMTLAHTEDYVTFCHSLNRYQRLYPKYPYPLEIRI